SDLKLRAEFPSGIIELTKVPGLSVKKVERLHESLKISNIDELKAACIAGRVRQVKGFGIKTEQKILDSITGYENREHRIHIHHALYSGTRILDYLQTSTAFLQGELAGSLRRQQETVSKIVAVACARRPADLVDHFLRFPLIAHVED